MTESDKRKKGNIQIEGGIVMLMIQRVKAMVRSEKGQGMVEYGLILALIAVVAVIALGPMGTTLQTMLEGVTAGL